MSFRPEIIRYLHDCYREDNSRSVLWNLVGSSVEHPIFIKGKEELLDGFLEETPLPFEKAKAAAEAATAYSKEKQLLYTVLPFIGKMALYDGKARSVFSPLLTFPAKITVVDDYATLSIELEGRRTNAGLLDTLQSDTGEAPLTDLIEAALDDWQIGETDISGLAKILATGISDLDVSTIWQYPELTDATTLRSTANKASLGLGFQLFPAAAVCLVKRPTESRGVLTELQEIAEQEKPSPPLRALISGENFPLSTPDTQPDAIPAVLSHSQTKILQRARTEPLSLVIGPPGTGKSYTIAAIALDHFNRGESVLIGSKMNHAVDVIANKIEDQLGGSGKVVRAGRRHYLRELKQYIDSLLTSSSELAGESATRVKTFTEAFSRTDAEVNSLERKIDRASALHLKWGDTLAELAAGSGSIFKRISGYFIARRHRNMRPMWEDLKALHHLLDQRSYLVAELLKNKQNLRIETGLTHSRSQIKTLRTALGARTGARQEKLFGDIHLETLFNILPIWLCNLSDVHRVLPNDESLFDVAIIDEASQCDIASCLPLLQRAKRAVIVGDPKQLRHLSFLATNRQKEFASNYRLSESEATAFDYRKQSILDLATERTESQKNINFLNEHFRSEPAIIKFSNRHFYSDKLNVMTEKPGQMPQPSLLHRKVDGKRSKEGINQAEADAVIAAISVQLESIGHQLPEGQAPSIGILSPFRAQVDYLASQINERLGNEIFTRNQALIGTAHTFQGEERDLMFLSFAIDGESPAMSRRFLERPDLFNVAITRGRLRQTVFTSIEVKLLPADSLLRQYLKFIETANSLIEPQSDETLAMLDRFSAEVRTVLQSRGFQVFPGCPVAGLKIDLLAVKDGKSLAIDLIGCPGPTAPFLPLERYKMFRRAGLTLWPLPYTDWFHNREQCVADIEANS